MTAAESKQITLLTTQVAELAGQVRTMIETTGLEIQHMRELCAERHGPTVERLIHLERSERRSLGFRARLQGMAVPVALFLGALSLVLTFVR